MNTAKMGKFAATVTALLLATGIIAGAQATESAVGEKVGSFIANVARAGNQSPADDIAAGDRRKCAHERHGKDGMAGGDCPRMQHGKDGMTGGDCPYMQQGKPEDKADQPDQEHKPR